MSYENKKDHPALTDEITSKFISLNNKGSFSMSKFKNYYFDFGVEISGEDYKSSVMFYRDLEIVKSTYSVKKWISRGSMTADVPEVQASVRHFYDPTMPENQRYLQDVAIGPIMSKAQENYPNPNINQVDWAIEGDKNDDPNGQYNHKYTWNNGKKWFIEACEKSNKQVKDSLMAMAWRALGETLHLIEDMGCPAHVRDDSHPAPKGYGHILGDPDTYEEYFYEKVNSNEITSFANSGKIDGNLKSVLSECKNIRQIAHNLAVWTNKNFFTNQTISGTNIYGATLKHIAHPSKEYASPKISESTYDPNTKYYEGTVGGHAVKHCVSHMSLYEFLWQGKTRGYPIFDEACVKSQAEVLLPNLVEAGVNAMKLFIPKLVVSINAIASHTVSGEIKLVTDEEYPKDIKYKGQVSIKNKRNGLQMIVDCESGSFMQKLPELEIKKGDLIEASISLGGMTISSDKFEAEDQTDGYACDIVKLYITYKYAKFTKEGSTSTYWNHELCSYGGYSDAAAIYFPGEQGKEYKGYWSGNKFTGSAKSSLLGPGTGNITIILSGDGKSITFLEATIENGYSDMNNFIINSGYVQINNQISATSNFWPDYMMEYKITEPNKDFITALNYKVKCKAYPEMVYTLLSKEGTIDNILVRFEVAP